MKEKEEKREEEERGKGRSRRCQSDMERGKRDGAEGAGYLLAGYSVPS